MSEEEKYNDIEQLMYRELSPDRYCYIHNYIIDLKSQLQQKENIIKEVREEVKEARLWNWTEQKILIDKFTKRLLEILDKGE